MQRGTFKDAQALSIGIQALHHGFTAVWNIGTTLERDHYLPFSVDPSSQLALPNCTWGILLAFGGILARPTVPVTSHVSSQLEVATFCPHAETARALNCTSFRWIAHSSLRQKAACPKAHPREGETALLQGKLHLLYIILVAITKKTEQQHFFRVAMTIHHNHHCSNHSSDFFVTNQIELAGIFMPLTQNLDRPPVPRGTMDHGHTQHSAWCDLMWMWQFGCLREVLLVSPSVAQCGQSKIPASLNAHVNSKVRFQQFAKIVILKVSHGTAGKQLVWFEVSKLEKHPHIP